MRCFRSRTRGSSCFLLPYHRSQNLQGEAELRQGECCRSGIHRRGRIRETLALSDHPQLKSGGGQCGPGEWVSATLCAPGSRALPRLFITRASNKHRGKIRRPTLGGGPLKLRILITPLVSKLPRMRLGPHLRENPSGFLNVLMIRCGSTQGANTASGGRGCALLPGIRVINVTSRPFCFKGGPRTFPVACHRTVTVPVRAGKGYFSQKLYGGEHEGAGVMTLELPLPIQAPS